MSSCAHRSHHPASPLACVSPHTASAPPPASIQPPTHDAQPTNPAPGCSASAQTPQRTAQCTNRFFKLVSFQTARRLWPPSKGVLSMQSSSACPPRRPGAHPSPRRLLCSRGADAPLTRTGQRTAVSKTPLGSRSACSRPPVSSHTTTATPPPPLLHCRARQPQTC